MQRAVSTLARAWAATLTRATTAYWAVQAATAVVNLGMGMLMLARVEVSPPLALSGVLLRALLDTLSFFLVTHVGLRPLLRLGYMQRQPGWLGWFGLLLWLLLMAVLTLLLSLAIDALDLTAGKSISAIRFQTGEGQLALDLAGGTLYLLVVLNVWVSYVIWSAFYLGWQAFRQRRRLQQQVAEARLAQLTHQLNPHFLFNAFNTIRGSIFENPQRAAELVTGLSELFRFHLRQSARSMQSLEEEWALAQRYLAIEQARLEQRLRLQVDLPEDCLPQRLPSLALLSLVENAIKHGIAPAPSGGELSIRAGRTAQGWWLEVCNSFDAAAARHAAGTGTGLANLRERLALGFGPAARLQLSAQASRYCVRLQLPLQPARPSTAAASA